MKDVKNKKEPTRICYFCGKEIIGTPESLKTRRGTDLSFHHACYLRQAQKNKQR